MHPFCSVNVNARLMNNSLSSLLSDQARIAKTWKREKQKWIQCYFRHKCCEVKMRTMACSRTETPSMCHDPHIDHMALCTEYHIRLILSHIYSPDINGLTNVRQCLPIQQSFPLSSQLPFSLPLFTSIDLTALHCDAKRSSSTLPVLHYSTVRSQPPPFPDPDARSSAAAAQTEIPSPPFPSIPPLPLCV